MQFSCTSILKRVRAKLGQRSFRNTYTSGSHNDNFTTHKDIHFRKLFIVCISSIVHVDQITFNSATVCICKVWIMIECLRAGWIRGYLESIKATCFTKGKNF